MRGPTKKLRLRMFYVRRERGDVGRKGGLGHRYKHSRNQFLLMSRIFIFFPFHLHLAGQASYS
jgi:hypothetical protein